MAVSTGNKALYSDMKNWYDVFNNLASSYSNGISTLTVPSSGSKISASQVNNLNDKIDAFRSDYYLGTQKTFWPTGTDVTVGTAIKPALTGILGVVTNAVKVVCRNIANNANGQNSCGNAQVSCQHLWHTNTSYSNVTCPDGSNWVGCNNVQCPNGEHHSGSYPNGKNPNGDCQNTSHGYNKKSCGSNTSGSCRYGSCLRWSGGVQYLYNEKASPVAKSNGWWPNVTRTCGTNDHGTCTSGSPYVTCTSGYHWNTCSDGTCQNGSYSNGDKTHGQKNNTCTSGLKQNTLKTSGSLIDILCNHATKTNG